MTWQVRGHVCPCFLDWDETYILADGRLVWGCKTRFNMDDPPTTAVRIDLEASTNWDLLFHYTWYDPEPKHPCPKSLGAWSSSWKRQPLFQCYRYPGLVNTMSFQIGIFVRSKAHFARAWAMLSLVHRWLSSHCHVDEQYNQLSFSASSWWVGRN